MAFHSIAYGPDELPLMTVDERELLAHDAQTESPKWRQVFERPLVAVAFVDPAALPGCQGANPWRTQSALRAVLVVDDEGRLRVFDPTLGQPMGELEPLGAPRALAASAVSSAVALAVEDSVIVWRGGERHDLRHRARALAFSADGATLAVATDEGELRTFDIASSRTPLAETFRCQVRGAVADVVQHPCGSWIVASSHGVFVVGASRASRVEKIPAGALRVCLDPSGARLAVQRSESALVVYEWPTLSVLMRVEYIDRPVRGVSFGSADWLGVGLDHGDGNKIDVVTSVTNRTDAHPGRPRRSWTLRVEGKKERLSAKDAEDVRRMKDPFHVAKEPRSGLSPRIGIGAMISIALISLRVCVRAATPSRSAFDYGGYAAPVTPVRCDRACASLRLIDLQTECASMAAGCERDADAALAALTAGRCAEAKSALARVEGMTLRSASASGGSGRPLVSYRALMARKGLDEACRDGAIRPKPAPKHATLVHLRGPALAPTVEEIPEAHPASGEEPRAAWAAPDGTVFVATAAVDEEGDATCVLHRRTAVGRWETVYERATDRSQASLFGRSASDVYLAAGSTVVHWDGSAWTQIAAPDVAGSIHLSGTRTDVFLARGDDWSAQLFRLRDRTWVREQAPPDVSVSGLCGGGSSIWGVGEDRSARPALLQRTANGAWVVKTPAASVTGHSSVHAGWVSPGGQAFFATDGAVIGSANAGWAVSPTPEPVDILWGRSSTDVYGASPAGLLHYDGKRWSETSYGGRIDALAGTPTEVLVVRADGG